MEKIIDTKDFGKKEIERVEKALEEAVRKRDALENGGNSSLQSTFKIKELAYAIGVGNMYLATLKRKWES